MPFSKRLSTVKTATLFVVTVCVALISLDGWRTWEDRKIQLRESEVSTSNMARALAQHADDTIKQADTLLIGLVERLRVDGSRPEAMERMHQLLMRRVGELPQLQGIFVFDKDGHWLVTSQAQPDTKFNNSDREYFIYHREHTDLGPHIGPPIKSRSTGRWIFTITRRANDKNGNFIGVVLSTIDIGYFQKFYESFDTGKSGAILLALNDGIMVLRRPLRKPSIGISLKDASLFRDHASMQESGNVVLRSTQDDVIRIISYRHLKSFPLFVSVGLSKDEVLENWRTDAYFHTAWIIFLATILAVLGGRMIVQIKRRAEAEKESQLARAELEKTNRVLEKMNGVLEKFALQDGLTGLPNRRHFDTVLEDEVSRATRGAGTLALIMMDVDHFKQFNDLYGHPAGDECLRRVGQAILLCENRLGDLVARYGGEEFCMILPNSDVAGALVVAERIRQEVRNLKIPHAANIDSIVTISLGVSAVNVTHQGETAVDLLAAADIALYKAKAGGRDQVSA
jgi:diguanylate cyclase (GGDEF)-like protein